MPNPRPSPTPLFREARRQRRPFTLTLLCAGGALTIGISWWLALSGEAGRAFGPGYWVYLSVTSLALAVALWGLWHLRRWALFAFPAALLLDNAVLAAMGELRAGALAFEAALVLLVLGHLRAFTGNPGQPEDSDSGR